MSCFKTVNRTVVQCSCGSAVEHYVSSAKGVGLILREHILTIQIKLSAKCINVNVVRSIPELQSFQFKLFCSVSSKEEMTGNRIVLLILLGLFYCTFLEGQFFCLILKILFSIFVTCLFFIKNKSKALKLIYHH